MRRCSWLACALALAATGCGGGGSGAPWLSDYPQRKPIDLFPPYPDPLDDITLAIVLDRDLDLAAAASPDATDLVITGADGTSRQELEVEAFDPETGGLVAWVRVPHLAGPTRLYLYYGGAGWAHDPRAAWSAPYTAVWHMGGEDLSTVRDSTAGGLDLAAMMPLERPALGDGIAGPARVFDGDDDVLVHATTAGLDPGTASFSFCGWANPSEEVGTFDILVQKGGSSAGDPGYDLELGTDEWVANIADPETSTRAVMVGQAAPLVDRWTQVCGVVDATAGTLAAYANGAPRAVEDFPTGGPGVTGAAPFTVGRQDDGQWPFAGAIDEIRLYGAALGDAWIAAEYANLAERERFLVVGDAEDMP